MAKTKRPSGLQVTRKGGKFTVSWKIADKDYGDGQTLQYKIHSGKKPKWHTVSGITTKTTKKNITVTLGNYHPSGKTVNAISFRVRGNRKKYTKSGKTINPAMSSWSLYKYDIKTPLKPSVTATRSETYAYTTSFAWKVKGAETDDDTIFTRVQYESVRLKNCNEANLEKAWTNMNKYSKADKRAAVGSTSADSSTSISESGMPSIATGDSYTRIFRVRSQGPQGSSKWTYSKHVYAKPLAPINESFKLKSTDGSGNAVYTAAWVAPESVAHPIDKSEVQYKTGTPLADDEPPTGTWETIVTVKDISGTNKDKSKKSNYAAFTLAEPAEDQYTWLVVANFHDGAENTTLGTPVIVNRGKLKDPTLGQIRTDSSTDSMEVDVTPQTDVPGTDIAVILYNSIHPDGICIGYAAAGSSGTQQTISMQDVPYREVASYRIGIQSLADAVFVSDGNGTYTIESSSTSSNVVQSSGDVPLAPENVNVDTVDGETLLVTWDWTWDQATVAEVSWSDYEHAWDSNEAPSTFDITAVKQSKFYITGLEAGKKWYVRVRLKTGTDEDATAGPYCETVEKDLSSAPNKPALELSSGVVAPDGSVVASWGFVSTDGTDQAYAVIAELVEGETEPVKLLTAETEQHITISPASETLEWSAGENHALVLQLTSASGKTSEWSDPEYLSVADPLVAEISQTSLIPATIPVEPGEMQNIDHALTTMPLTVTVTGADETGHTILMIKRLTPYTLDRPDESEVESFQDEAVALIDQAGEGQISIDLDDDAMIGRLDDGAMYYLEAVVYNEIIRSEPARMPFMVFWDEQPEQLTADDIEIEARQDDEIVVIGIQPESEDPTGTTYDIYRLSVDRPVLIYEDAESGDQIVDPYPALGEGCGHRIVRKSKYGDYICTDEDGQDAEFSWIDMTDTEGDIIESEANIINFGTGRATLAYNIDLSNSWKKSFETTSYLGGSIQGDWLASVERTGSASGVHVVAQSEDEIQAMRRLADYAGICHIRTKDGSSFACNIDLSEARKQSTAHKIAEYDMSITRVDTEGLDGMTLADWEAIHPDEDEENGGE